MRYARRYIRAAALALSICTAALLVSAGAASADTVWNGVRTSVVVSTGQ